MVTVKILTRNLRPQCIGKVTYFVEELAENDLPRKAERAWEFVKDVVDQLSKYGCKRVERLGDVFLLEGEDVKKIVFGDPFDKKSIRRIKREISGKGVELEVVNDVSLISPEDIKPYKVFTPFRNKVLDIMAGIKQTPYMPCRIRMFDEADKVLKRAMTMGDKYAKNRDNPSSEHGKTGLGPYLSRGLLCPIRVFHSLKNVEALQTQIVWREFYNHLRYHNQDIDKIEWREDRVGFNWNKSTVWWNRFKEGKTGFPLVDAGIRELIHTGYMHNRVRMVVAQFLVKDLLIDWRKGERLFAKYLKDYDISSNAGNWQWNAGTGTDPEPFGKPRIFNPWSQQERHDPCGAYIAKWLDISKTPNPIVDHSERRTIYLNEVKRLKENMKKK